MSDTPIHIVLPLESSEIINLNAHGKNKTLVET